MSADGRRGKRRLSPEERRLWKDITQKIEPLRDAPLAEDTADRPEIPVAKPFTPAARVTAPATPPKPKNPPALAPLGRRMKQRVARGKDAIDGRLDLHGYTQAEAHGALLHFLRLSQARGARLVVVITGKGSRRGDGESGGVLQRQVPLWLNLPEFRAFVVGLEPAHPAHGGEGALYVRLRRGPAD
jgi:DNA-nicking Smr family endonuclease